MMLLLPSTVFASKMVGSILQQHLLYSNGFYVADDKSEFDMHKLSYPDHIVYSGSERAYTLILFEKTNTFF